MAEAARKNHPTRVLWAVDPWDRNPKHREKMARLLQVWSESVPEKAEVVPVSVVSPAGLRWPLPLEPHLMHQWHEIAEKSVEDTLAQLPLKTHADPMLVDRVSSSTRELVNSMVELSQEKHAKLIAVDTRGPGERAKPLGGFADALIATSKVPVLAVSPEATVSDRISTILFPTDFSPRSHRAFLKVLAIAREVGAKMILFHVESPPEPILGFPEPALTINAALMEEEARAKMELHRETCEKWVQHSKKEGVDCESIISTKWDRVGDAIIESAVQYGASLIAMPTFRGRFTQAVLGSTSREVLHKATVPVLVMHEHH